MRKRRKSDWCEVMGVLYAGELCLWGTCDLFLTCSLTRTLLECEPAMLEASEYFSLDDASSPTEKGREGATRGRSSPRQIAPGVGSFGT